MSARLPLRSFRRLWHVGTLNPADKRSVSHEGRGLSVSVHPQEWTQIARLGGPVWELSRHGNTFLDYHALSPAQRAAITAWGVGRGFVEQRTVFEVRYYDEEYDDTCVMTLATRVEAEEEAEDGQVVEVVRPVATAAFPDPTVRDGEIDPHQVLTVLWVEQAHPGLDGVWWQDTYDPAVLSCPRGVIHPAKVAEWSLRQVSR